MFLQLFSHRKKYIILKRRVFKTFVFLIIYLNRDFLPFGRAVSRHIFRLRARRSEVPRLPRPKPKSAAIPARELSRFF